MVAVPSRSSHGVFSSKGNLPHPSPIFCRADKGSSLVRHPRMPRSPWHFSLGYLLPCSLDSRSYTLVYLRPFATIGAFGSFGPASLGCCPFSFTLQTAAGFHRLKVHHYYGLVCHPAPPLLSLAFRLVRAYQVYLGWYRASPVKSAYLNMNPSVLTPQVIQLSGFPTLRKVAHLRSQPRFACATFHVLPSASFRPRRCRQRPCLRIVFPLVR